MRFRLPLTLAAVLAAAGCGSATAVTSPPPPSSSTATPQPATAAPTATPTPTPRPLVVLQSDTGVQVVDGSGVSQWSLTEDAINRLVSTDPSQFPVARAAGDDVFLFGDHHLGTTFRPGTVAVIDRMGRTVGTGAFGTYPLPQDVAPDPSSTQWAWSVDDTSASSARPHGRIMVAGLGIPEHAVYGWVAPVGATETVGAWTDMGIVMKRFAYGGCGVGFLGDGASFLIDPAAGTLTDLFSGDHYLDARHGARVSRAVDTESKVSINGTPFDESGTIVEGGYVSPDGSLVGVARLTPVGCAGDTRQPKLGTELVTVATGAHVDRSGCLIAGWFDATHYACRSLSNAVVTLNDLSGNTVATLGNGEFIGALQSAQ